MVEIWLPGQDDPKWVCRLCQKKFYEGEHRAYLRHMKQCVSDNRGLIEDLSPRNRLPFMFDPAVIGDPEYEQAVQSRAVVKPDGSWHVPARKDRSGWRK